MVTFNVLKPVNYDERNSAVVFVNADAFDKNHAVKYYVEGVCLSSDIKPVGWANGSKLMEMDTQTLYLYDETNSTWRAWS